MADREDGREDNFVYQQRARFLKVEMFGEHVVKCNRRLQAFVMRWQKSTDLKCHACF